MWARQGVHPPSKSFLPGCWVPTCVPGRVGGRAGRDVQAEAQPLPSCRCGGLWKARLQVRVKCKPWARRGPPPGTAAAASPGVGWNLLKGSPLKGKASRGDPSPLDCFPPIRDHSFLGGPLRDPATLLHPSQTPGQRPCAHRRPLQGRPMALPECLCLWGGAPLSQLQGALSTFLWRQGPALQVSCGHSPALPGTEGLRTSQGPPRPLPVPWPLPWATGAWTCSQGCFLPSQGEEVSRPPAISPTLAAALPKRDTSWPKSLWKGKAVGRLPDPHLSGGTGPSRRELIAAC